jgi:hypothetical protein
MASEKEEHKIVISWILAHKGIKGNEEADILAKATCSKMDTFKKSTRAYALCTNKEENLKDWKERWLGKADSHGRTDTLQHGNPPHTYTTR